MEAANAALKQAKAADTCSGLAKLRQRVNECRVTYCEARVELVKAREALKKAREDKR